MDDHEGEGIGGINLEGIHEWALPGVSAGLFDVFDIPSHFDILFWTFKKACIETASEISPDPQWVTDLGTYLHAAATPEPDKNAILHGWNRSPTYYSGGLVLRFNSEAGAITLDDCVFVGGGNWDPNTYVHEMVHVGQYGQLGVEGFVAAYFGSSAITVVERWLRGQPVDIMTSSFLETSAYAIGNRFDPAHTR